MKNGWNKKIIIISGLVMVLFLTAFLPWNMPNLINADKPFIDLSGSIGESIGNANKAYEKSKLESIPDDDPTPTTTPSPNDITDISDPNNQMVWIVAGDSDISGSGESVAIEGESRYVISDLFENGLDSVIQQFDLTGRKVILVDNYAETKTMNKIKHVLEKYGIEYRIESTE